MFSKISYFAWRITKGDLLQGIKRRLQRNKGDFSDPINDIEYHVTRSGVNQTEIIGLLEKEGFNTEYYPYFSTQSFLFQWLGQRLKVKSNFAVVAKR